MDVSIEKVASPTLFDLIAPRPASEAAAGPSFRDCLEPRTSGPAPSSAAPARKPSDYSSEEPLPRKPERTEVDCPAKENIDSSSSASETAPADEAETTHDEQASDDSAGCEEEGVVIMAAAVTAVMPIEDEQPIATLDGVAVVAAEESSGKQDRPAKPSAEELGKPTLTLPETLLDETAPALEAPAAAQSSEVVFESSATLGASAVLSVAAAVVEEAEPGESTSPAVAIEKRHDRSARAKIAIPSEDAAPALPAELEAAEHHAMQVTPVEKKSEAARLWHVEETTPLPEESSEHNTPDSQQKVDPATATVEPIVAPADPTTPVAPETISAAPVAATSDAPPTAAQVARPPHALLRAKAAASENAAPATEIDPARFLNRVAKAFHSAQQRDGEVRLRLHPAELGSLSIEVKVQEGVLTARVQAETPEARTALVDNLPQLRERLAEQGIRIDKFDVDLMDHSDRQPHQSREEQENRRAGVPTNRRTAEPASVENRREPGIGRTGDNQGLNVVV